MFRTKFISTFILLMGSFLMINAQSNYSALNTMSIEDYIKKVEQSDNLMFDGFQSANIYAGSKIEQNLLVNYSEKTNQFFVKNGQSVDIIDNQSLKGVFFANGTIFKKINENRAQEICRVIYSTERIFVYKLDNKFYSFVGGISKELEPTTSGIEMAFDIKSNSIHKYIKANNLDLTKEKDLILALRQYEISTL